MHANATPFANMDPTSLSQHAAIVNEEVSLSTCPSCDSLFSLLDVDVGADYSGIDFQVPKVPNPSQDEVHVPNPWAEVEEPQPPQVTHTFNFQHQQETAPKYDFERADQNNMLARLGAEAVDEYNTFFKSKCEKVPPGTTPVNRSYLFAKRSYWDHSHQGPDDNKDDWPRTPSRTFPMKLHEALTQIENDGLDSIVGWLPHGRSFMIHKPKEFEDYILPKYFTMTKKSSFLRQLRLYGFNRLTGKGPDQGHYCHEKFLRGKHRLAVVCCNFAWPCP